ncbi:hypothetical protein B0H16DRAFT_1712791 [Mycena metata]|uniref:Uncharacterized protein n=1 Tax=Mycena metata TaxID=1033252 RepID=A0AAD7K4D0_9AGAR|nr:hypothetical protein B0H16DRAFT_1712791 [Mycena metata]
MSGPVHPIEIVGEKGKRYYEIQKTGTDPETGKPWATSWIPKSRVANEVVDPWKAKLKKILEEWEATDRAENSAPRIRATSTVGMCNLPSSSPRAPSNPRLEPSNPEGSGQEAPPIANKRKRVDSPGDEALPKSKGYATAKTAGDPRECSEMQGTRHPVNASAAPEATTEHPYDAIPPFCEGGSSPHEVMEKSSVIAPQQALYDPSLEPNCGGDLLDVSATPLEQHLYNEDVEMNDQRVVSETPENSLDLDHDTGLDSNPPPRHIVFPQREFLLHGNALPLTMELEPLFSFRPPIRGEDPIAEVTTTYHRSPKKPKPRGKAKNVPTANVNGSMLIGHAMVPKDRLPTYQVSPMKRKELIDELHRDPGFRLPSMLPRQVFPGNQESFQSQILCEDTEQEIDRNFDLNLRRLQSPIAANVPLCGLLQGTHETITTPTRVGTGSPSHAESPPIEGNDFDTPYLDQFSPSRESPHPGDTEGESPSSHIAHQTPVGTLPLTSSPIQGNIITQRPTKCPECGDESFTKEHLLDPQNDPSHRQIKVDVLFKTGKNQKSKRLTGPIVRNKDFMFRCTPYSRHTRHEYPEQSRSINAAITPSRLSQKTTTSGPHPIVKHPPTASQPSALTSTHLPNPSTPPFVRDHVPHAPSSYALRRHPADSPSSPPDPAARLPRSLRPMFAPAACAPHSSA